LKAGRDRLSWVTCCHADGYQCRTPAYVAIPAPLPQSSTSLSDCRTGQSAKAFMSGSASRREVSTPENWSPCMLGDGVELLAQMLKAERKMHRESNAPLSSRAGGSDPKIADC
jgi:hypothetical protein